MPEQSESEKRKKLKELKENTSVKDMSKEDAGKFAYFLRRLKDNTDNNLTDTEYDHLAHMELFLDHYEEYVKESGIGNVDAMLIDTSRKFREKILSVLQKNRESANRPESFLEGLKKMSARYDKDKTLVEMEFEGDGK